MNKIFKSRTINAGSNAKTVKGDGEAYITAIMYLAPADSSGLGNVCPMAILAGCKAPCLFTAGRARDLQSINKARVAKTQRYFASRSKFMAELVRDIERFSAWCVRQGAKPAVRLNGTSDIQWELAHPCVRTGVVYANIFAAFPNVQFYDYTKIAKRVKRTLPANYHLTLSYSAANADYADMVIDAALETGANVAIVYRSKALRDQFMAEGRHYLGRVGFGMRAMARPVINGDLTDMRFLDAQGVIVGLYAKGSAKHDTSGFVVG